MASLEYRVMNEGPGKNDVCQEEKSLEYFREIAIKLLGKKALSSVRFPKCVDYYSQNKSHIIFDNTSAEISPIDILAEDLFSFAKGRKDSWIRPVLKQYLKNGVELSFEELNKYCLQRDFKKTDRFYECMRPGFLSRHSDLALMILDVLSGDQVHAGRYYDSEFNFCLTYENKLVASIGFDAEFSKILVSQIQGSYNFKEKLNLFKWERCLLNYAFNWAQSRNVSQVEVLSVANNKWAEFTFNNLKKSKIYSDDITFQDAKKFDFDKENAVFEEGKKQKCEIHLMPHQGLMHYDVTAKRCGFKKQENGNYLKFT